MNSSDLKDLRTIFMVSRRFTSSVRATDCMADARECTGLNSSPDLSLTGGACVLPFCFTKQFPLREEKIAIEELRRDP